MTKPFEFETRGNTETPTRAIIFLHGRGSTAVNILSLADQLDLSHAVALAPQAPLSTWYPYRFYEARSKNEPHLSAALSIVSNMLEVCEAEYGVPTHHVILAGFSQGACLAAHYAAMYPQQYGGVCIMSGGLIGSDEEIEATLWQGSLDGTLVYLGCDAQDQHIPLSRVKRTAAVFEALQAETTLRVYTGMGHTIHHEAIDFLTETLKV